MDLNKLYDFIIAEEIATQEEVDLVTSINGWNEEAMNDIIEIRTGYHSMAQYLGEDNDEDEEDEEE